MTDRRQFLGAGATVLASVALSQLGCSSGAAPVTAQTQVKSLVIPDDPPETLATNEGFWQSVRERYDLRADVVNLDHGWTNPPPRAAMDAQYREIRELAELPAEELYLDWENITSKSTRSALAQIMGVPPEETALVRNATEALDTVLLGLPLNAGDEIVCSSHDYYAMLDALEQRRARDGVVLKMVKPPVPAPSLNALAELYEQAIGPRTRLVLLTHPSNITGQLLPVQRIADAAHRAGALVVVDGAQSLGLLENPVLSLDCDFYGASLHKWLGAPVGLGVLWMRPEHMSAVWPLVPPPPWAENMARYEWIGTVPDVGPASIPALALHSELGVERKAARLRYLAAVLREKVDTALPGAQYLAASTPDMSCGITTMSMPNENVVELQRTLREQHGILVQAMTELPNSPEINGIRVTPNVYTSLQELDALAAALKAT